MVKILRLILGYVTVKIIGGSSEGFINACYRHNVRLYDSRITDYGFFAKVNTADYKKIRKFRKKYGVKVKIIKKRGIPFLIFPYKKRYGIFAGIPLYFALIAFLSLFVWNIEVVGTKNTSDAEVLETCKKIGVFEGTPIWEIDTNSLRLRFLMENPKYSWSSFISEGSHITVNVSETKEKTVTDTHPANLISKCDGTVTKVMVKKGSAAVKVNEPVFKGQLLASGTVEYSDGSTHIVNATGEVIAETRHEVRITVPNTIKEKRLIKNYETQKILCFFSCKIPLSLSPVKYSNKKHTVTEKIEYNGAYLPIYIKKVVYDKEYTVTLKPTETEQIKIAKRKFKEYERNNADVKILSYKDENIRFENELLCVRKYICEENIAISEKIKINVSK